MNALGRRGFLVGGAALAASALAGGATTRQGRRVLHAAGLLDGGDHSPPAGHRVRATYRTLASSHAGRDVRYGIAVPPRANGAPTPVVYCLHGRGGDERFATETIRLQDFLAAANVNIAVASVDGGESYWHAREDGTDTLAMVLDELVPLVDAEFGNGRSAVLGWSMGGYGALLAAARHGMVAVATSPALWRRFEDSAPGAFDRAEDFAANDVFALAGAIDRTKVRIDCGADDPFVERVRTLRARLGEPSGAITAGFHDARYWRKAAAAQVGFLASHLT
jgi:S-formylglutathione hydrolase FrmB